MKQSNQIHVENGVDRIEVARGFFVVSAVGSRVDQEALRRQLPSIWGTSAGKKAKGGLPVFVSRPSVNKPGATKAAVRPRGGQPTR